VFALIAAAIEPKAIGALETYGAMLSLRDVIAKDMTAREVPELFCFGLLEQSDLKQIEALIAPRPVRNLR
jgi:hypothetical protein